MANHSVNQTRTLEQLTNDTNFDFINTLHNNTSNIDNVNFFSNNPDSPYSNTSFPCSYSSVEDIPASGNPFSILNINIQSLNAKYSELKDLVLQLVEKKCSPDVIALTELWKFPDAAEFSITGYKPLIYKLRHGKTQGGGVGFYVKDNIQCTIDLKSSIFVDRIFESLVIDVRGLDNKRIKIAVVYRPNTPLANFTPSEITAESFELLNNLLAALGNFPSYIVGDLNIDLLKVNTCKIASEYLDTLFSYGFLQVITKPTRVSYPAATLIDHAITNVSQHKHSSLIITSKISDHFPFILNIEFKTAQHAHKTIEIRDLTNIDNFKTVLLHEDWSPVTDSNCAQDAYDTFQKNFNTLFEAFLPTKKVKLNRNVHKAEKWFTNGLLISRREKIRLENLCAKNPTESNIVKFKKFKNLYNVTLNAAKKIYYNEELCQNQSNLKKTWEIIRAATNRKTKKSKNEIEILVAEGGIIENPKDIADHLNNFFVTAPLNIVNEIRPTARHPPSHTIEPPPQHPVTQLNNEPNVNPITQIELLHAVNLLENKFSTDSNNLSMSLIKKIISSILPPLIHIFNLSLSSGIVPHQFKTAKIIPIFKGGDPRSADNYRPISLLNNFSKIIEKIISIRLTSFLETNSLISNFQFGFRKEHSTIHPLIKFHNFIAETLDKKEHAIAIFCDLRKAFDTVNHLILKNKLQKLGIRGTLYNWLCNYLDDRQQFVYINGISSKNIEIKIGVPQGSILGPLLFLLYINDLSSCSKLLTLMFADDTTLLASNSNIETLFEIVNQEFYKVVTFFRDNKLALHPKKTNFLLYSNSHTAKSTRLNLFINNCNPGETFDNALATPITRVHGTDQDPAVKFLGVYFDPELNFKYHISLMRGKISSGLFFLRSVKNLLEPKALTSLYYSLIHSHIIYGIQVWTSCNQGLINDIFKLQKKAIRIIHSAAYNCHTESLFSKSKILPLPDLIYFFKIQFMQQYVNGFLPKIFDNTWLTFETRRQNLNIYHALRNSDNLYLPFARLTSSSKHPFFLFPRLWQNFNEESIKILRNKIQFNSNLKKFLINKLNPNFTCNRLMCPHCSSITGDHENLTSDSDSN